MQNCQRPAEHFEEGEREEAYREKVQQDPFCKEWKANFPPSWWGDIKQFINWKAVIWSTQQTLKNSDFLCIYEFIKKYCAY